jgi:hypothetical protein
MPAKPSKYFCGVEQHLCGGSTFIGSGSMKASRLKVHASPEAAHACMGSALVKEGYTKLDNCTFRPPDGGPVRVLTRPGRFGARLRSGKEGSRHMPAKRTGGVVISK